MLTLRLITSIEEEKKIYDTLGLDDNPGGVLFLFLDDEKPVGFARNFLQADGSALLDKIYYLDDVSFGDKDFFLRSVLYKYQGASMLLKLEGDHKELYKFGFVYEDGYTSIWSQNINLHGGCSNC